MSVVDIDGDGGPGHFLRQILSLSTYLPPLIIPQEALRTGITPHAQVPT